MYRYLVKNDGGDVATLIQANSYYPFGLEIPELSYVSGDRLWCPFLRSADRQVACGGSDGE
jgi:hypothetical protein